MHRRCDITKDHATGREFWSAIGAHWSRFIGVNVLFLVTCIPIVTIPCALTAMSRVLGLSIQRKVCYPFTDYVHAFKTDWKRSSLVGLVTFTVLACSLIGAWFYGGASFFGSAFLSCLCLVIAVLVLAVMMYAFPGIAFTDLSVREILLNSLLLVMARLPQTALTVLLMVAFVAAQHLLMPYSAVVPLVFGCSFVGLCCVRLALDGLQRYVIFPGGDAKA